MVCAVGGVAVLRWNARGKRLEDGGCVQGLRFSLRTLAKGNLAVWNKDLFGLTQKATTIQFMEISF